MNLLQMMGIGGVSGMGFGGGMPMGGMQFLLGAGMGMGMPMAGPLMMYQMMSQFMAQQPQQPVGSYPQWQANQGQQVGNHPQFQPDEAASPYQQMQDLKAFANKNGSRDGTPVADWTNVHQDTAAGEYITRLEEKQADVVLRELKNISPQERELLKAEEEKLQTQIRQREADGRPMTGSEKHRAQLEYTERLYSEGKINDKLGTANRQGLELKRYGDQTYANMFLKNGVPLPADMPRDAVNRSPYNLDNQQGRAA